LTGIGAIFAPVIGGLIAGLIAKGGTGSGAITGIVMGIIAAIPVLAVAGKAMRDWPIIGEIIAGAAVFLFGYLAIFGLIGGVIGGAIAGPSESNTFCINRKNGIHLLLGSLLLAFGVYLYTIYFTSLGGSR
jgi:hypothetical protein